jgi:hypothetical protein
MTLNEILENKELAILKKKSELMKSDFSNVLFDSVDKAISSASQTVEVLIYETTISKARNQIMFDQYKNGYVLNHSVGMRYVKLLLCINSEQDYNAEEKANWDKYYDIILNKDQADKKGYFWAVVESKNVEGSAVVKGSNFLTPMLSIEIIDENTIRVKNAVNVCCVMDSHDDVHIPKCWNKTLKENTYDLLLQEHDMEFDKVIADSVNDDLKVYTEEVSIKELLSKFKKNKSGAGSTTPKHEPSKDTQTTKKTPSFGVGILY